MKTAAPIRVQVPGPRALDYVEQLIADGFEAYGDPIEFPVKTLLTPPEIAEYGRRVAENRITKIPEVSDRYEAPIADLKDKAKKAEEETQYFMTLVIGDATEENAQQLAQATAEQNSIETCLQSLKLEQRAELVRLETESAVYVHRINSGFEMRPSPCQWYVNWRGKTKRLVAIGGGFPVQEKILHPDELQLSLLWEDITDEIRQEMSGDE